MTSPLLRPLAVPGSTYGPVSLPGGAQSVIVDNPLLGTIYLLFASQTPRLPTDPAGAQYDRIVPPLAHQVIPLPDGAAYVSALLDYGGQTAEVISSDTGKFATIEASSCAWAPSSGFNDPAGALITPDATFPGIKTGSAVLANLATTGLFTTAAPGFTRMMGLTFTCDTAGLVQFGVRVGAGPPGLTAVYGTWIARLGVPYRFPIPQRGMSAGDTTTVWCAQHQIAGATLAWTLVLA